EPHWQRDLRIRRDMDDDAAAEEGVVIRGEPALRGRDRAAEVLVDERAELRIAHGLDRGHGEAVGGWLAEDRLAVVLSEDRCVLAGHGAARAQARLTRRSVDRWRVRVEVELAHVEVLPRPLLVGV